MSNDERYEWVPPKRTVCVEGYTINPLGSYHKALSAIKEFIDEMRRNDTDMSDQIVGIHELFSEANFHWKTQPKNPRTRLKIDKVETSE